MTSVLVCWKCGAALGKVLLPLSRVAECPGCGAELHVCRMCRHFEPHLRQGCREERAEQVRERERANFCDYFMLQPDAHQPQDEVAARHAQAQLDALFGGGSAGSAGVPQTTVDAAREELERLFGADGKREE
jgi:hypothetical protein